MKVRFVCSLTAAVTFVGVAVSPAPASPLTQMGAAGMEHDRVVFHYLLAHHAKVRRSVQFVFDGVVTLTESDNPAVAAKLREHVPQMYARLREGRGVHLADPLFAELFRHGRAIDPYVMPTARGVRVLETSMDPYVVKLTQAHAREVDELVALGIEAMTRMHALPKRGRER